jgi:3-oxoadipate enol-lactonase
MDALGIVRAHVVGSSMGGAIAQELAIAYPERVDRLVLMATAARARWMCGALDDGAMWTTLLRRAGRLSPPALARSLRRWARVAVGRVRRGGPPASPRPPAPAHGLRRQQEALAAFDAHDRLPRISAPTLVIAGARDREVPLAAAEELAHGIPGARLVVLRGAGHLMHYERAGEVNRLLLTFLRAPSDT